MRPQEKLKNPLREKRATWEAKVRAELPKVHYICRELVEVCEMIARGEEVDLLGEEGIHLKMFISILEHFEKSPLTAEARQNEFMQAWNTNNYDSLVRKYGDILKKVELDEKRFESAPLSVEMEDLENRLKEYAAKEGIVVSDNVFKELRFPAKAVGKARASFLDSACERLKPFFPKNQGNNRFDFYRREKARSDLVKKLFDVPKSQLPSDGN